MFDQRYEFTEVFNQCHEFTKVFDQCHEFTEGHRSKTANEGLATRA